jgi:hypothetical protein
LFLIFLGALGDLGGSGFLVRYSSPIFKEEAKGTRRNFALFSARP